MIGRYCINLDQLYDIAKNDGEVNGLFLRKAYDFIPFKGKIFHDTLILAFTDERIWLSSYRPEIINELSDDEKTEYEKFIEGCKGFWYFVSELSKNHYKASLQINDIHGIFIFPKEFEKKYENFLRSNKKKTETLTYIIDTFREISQLAYCWTSGNIHYFEWLITEIFQNHINPYQFMHVMTWVEKHGDLQKKLKKRCVIAYHGRAEIIGLVEEMTALSMQQRAHNIMQRFNTTQRNILKENENEKTIELVLEFSKLSSTKQQNFIRKISTYDNYDDIIREMENITKQYLWNKESFIEFLNNSPTLKVEIKEAHGNIVVVKVNDYESCNCLGKNTNWCISKSKASWFQYTTCQNQYMLFNFDRQEDDYYSIIGVTTDFDGKITDSFNFVDKDLLRCMSTKSLPTYLPISTWSVKDILENWGICMTKYIEPNKYGYRFNKNNVLKRLQRYGKSYLILQNGENNLVVRMNYIVASKYFLRRGIDDKLYGSELCLFFDFSKPKENPNSIRYAKIDSFSKYDAENAFEVYDTDGNEMNITFSELIDEFDLPYDIVSRPPSLRQQIKYAFLYYDTYSMKKLLSDKETIYHVKQDDQTKVVLKNCIVRSIASAHSFEVLNIIYDCGSTLLDLIGYSHLYNLVEQLLRELQTFSKGLMPIDDDRIKQFNQQTLVNPQEYKFIGCSKALSKILSSETEDVSEHIINKYKGDFCFDTVCNTLFINKL